MSRNHFGAAAALVVLGAASSPVDAQTTFQACRVPGVGAIYMINVAGAPNACLDASHVQFSWTEGAAPAANSVTSAMIADGTIVAADIANTTITGNKLAAGAVGSTEILDSSIGTVDIANGAITTAKLAVPPKAAYFGGSTISTILGTTFASLGSVSITVGGAGNVVVQATGTSELSGSNCSYIYYGVAKAPTGTPTVQSYLNRSDFGATGVATFSYNALATVLMDPVNAAGTYTYYFVARASNGAGCGVFNNGMTAIFIPS